MEELDSWGRSAVLSWVQECCSKYELQQVPSDAFQMNGRALLMLTQADFVARSSHAGDVLFRDLQQRLTSAQPYLPGSDVNTTQCCKNVMSQESKLKSSQAITSETSRVGAVARPCATAQPDSTISDLKGLQAQEPERKRQKRPNPSKLEEALVASPPKNAKSSSENLDTVLPTSCHPLNEQLSDCRVLWAFLFQLLRDEKFSTTIHWVDESELVFHIADPENLAYLWGVRKQKPSMTYDKLARAIRYYYKMGILRRVNGRKFTFQFLKEEVDVQTNSRLWRPTSSQAPSARLIEAKSTLTTCNTTSERSPSTEQQPTLYQHRYSPSSATAYIAEARDEQTALDLSVPSPTAKLTATGVSCNAQYISDSTDLLNSCSLISPSLELKFSPVAIPRSQVDLQLQAATYVKISDVKTSGSVGRPHNSLLSQLIGNDPG